MFDACGEARCCSLVNYTHNPHGRYGINDSRLSELAADSKRSHQQYQHRRSPTVVDVMRRKSLPQSSVPILAGIGLGIRSKTAYEERVLLISWIVSLEWGRAMHNLS